MATTTPKIKRPKDITYDKVTADQVEYEGFDPTDVNFNYDQVKPGQLANRFMTAADYTLIDPADVAAEFGDINRNEIRKNSELSSGLALDTLNTELQGLKNFVPAASNLKREQTALDNTFNQGERDRQIAAGDPNLKSDLEGQRTRATAFANGRLPDSIQDRALELGIQSRSTDRAASSGFGVRSMAAQKASALMSAEQRIALSQYGDQALTSNIGNRAQLLLAPTEYSDAGSQVKVTPTQSAGQIALGIASEANAGNITSRDALASKTQQGQFSTGLEQDTRKTNLEVQSSKDLNQARLDLEADTTNVNNDLKVQTFGKELSSKERMFESEIKHNTKTANAERNFQASNINAGRALEVASSNRATRLEVQKTNTAMVFQDQQRRASDAAAAGRAAMSINASKEEAALNRAFQLQQQGQAMEVYKDGQDKARTAQNWATAGTVVTRAPQIIAAVSAGVDTVSNWWDSNSTTIEPNASNTNSWTVDSTTTPEFTWDTGSGSTSQEYTL